MRAAFLFAVLFWAPLFWAPLLRAQFIGSAACGACHHNQFVRQSASAHARALADAALLVGTLPLGERLVRKPEYGFAFLQRNGAIIARVHDSHQQVMELPLEWAFGAGLQAVTFVSRVSAEWYVEHYASFYPNSKTWGPTPGQDALLPADLARAAGLLYKTSDRNVGVDGCFECHSTGPLTFGPNNEIKPYEKGVHCEACHGPGAAHAARPSQQNVFNPKRLSAESINDFCGKCHRMPAPGGETTDFNYAWNVRHQPVYLNQSACFLKSGGRLTCLTCHDPHEPDKRPVALFNSRCHDCHAKTNPACRTNCVDCHMPIVSPQANLQFTNHWIGVYGNGAKLKPVR